MDRAAWDVSLARFLCLTLSGHHTIGRLCPAPVLTFPANPLCLIWRLIFWQRETVSREATESGYLKYLEYDLKLRSLVKT